MSRSGRKRTCASVDVSLPDHKRLKRIPFGPRRGHALGVWLAALCHSRLHELDGFCLTEVLHDVAGDEVIQDLVNVGLFGCGEQHGVVGVVVNDAEGLNGLPWDEQLQVRQAASDEAKAKHRRRTA